MSIYKRRGYTAVITDVPVSLLKTTIKSESAETHSHAFTWASCVPGVTAAESEPEGGPDSKSPKSLP